ncbi:coronin-6 [Polychaeton citri CBS 116435]|uniref:Coronin n=1 Tax=Polychaeton citri CBS 116435 TaxID=1314669 RepID=A0A9P4QJF4_9PEZI|nr:coronin-6 [Polychaeton citri CBS 116435]
MSGRFVRASKYRHVFGRSTKKEQCYDNLRISKNAWDTNLIKANPSYLSVNWEASGGGAFAVIPLEERGKLPEILPLFRGHTAAVLDTDWSPFDDSLIASGSDDGKVFLWKVPEGFTLYSDAEEPEDVKPVGKLSGHSRKVGHVLFNPAAENILASASGDYSIKLWDLEDGQSKLQLKHNDTVQSLSWSANGDMLVTTCRDKKLRFWDVRQQKPAHEVAGHSGAKNSRCVWMGDHDRVATTGFSKMSDRQLGLWDLRNPTTPVGGDFTYLDSISGVCMPFWDDGCQMLYLAGKGDGNIRYYEYENDKFEPLSEHKSPEPQRGIAFMPKRGVNTHDNEVMRAFKTTNDSYIEPISFIVPRRSENFQDDIYPPATGSTPAMSSGEWLEGKVGLPPKLSMADIFDGNKPKEIPAEEVAKPAPAKVAPPAASASTARASAPPTPAEQTPVPSAASKEAPSINDNKASMSAMANKFADKDEDDEKASESSFEEVPKPVERPAAALIARQEEKTGVRTPPQSQPSPTKTTSAAASVPIGKESLSSKSPTISKPLSDVKPEAEKEESKPTASISSAAGGLRDVLSDIKGLLQTQGKQIAELTQEVAELKSRLGQS